MADVNKDAIRREITHSGTYGNKTGRSYSYEASAVAANDKIYLGKIPAGSEICFSRLVFDDLGTGATLDVGWEYIDGTAGGGADVLFDGVDVSTAAGSSDYAGFTQTLERDAYLYATPLGAAITGTLEVILDWIFHGSK